MKRTRIKFCGLVRPEDVDTAVAVGADAVGFVFHPKSPRFVDTAAARALRSRLPSYVCAVGLFVDPSADTLRATVAGAGLDVVQFHGDERPEQCARATALGLPYWRAVRMASPADLLESFERFPGAEAWLLDAPSAGYGGSGTQFDWSWVPRQPGRRIVLAGGLTPENVGRGIAEVAPMAVDVSSGIQGANAREKSSAKMERFVAAVIEADARSAMNETR